MTTKLRLYNGALRNLGNPLISSLSEEISVRYYLDSVWEDGVIDTILERGKWSFAKRTMKISASTTIIPAFGSLKYAFQQPSDFIKLVGIWQDATCVVPLLWYQYQANIFYSDQDTIYLQYVSNAPTFGGNLAAWPSTVEQYAQVYMALEAEPFVTNSQAKNQELQKKLLIAERMALTSDGLNKPIQVNPIGRWNRARLFNYPANGINGLVISSN